MSNQEMRVFESFLKDQITPLANSLYTGDVWASDCVLIDKLYALRLLIGAAEKYNTPHDCFEYFVSYIDAQKKNSTFSAWESSHQTQSRYVLLDVRDEWEVQKKKFKNTSNISKFQVVVLLGGESGEGEDEYSVCLRGTDITIKECKTEQEAEMLAAMLNKIAE